MSTTTVDDPTKYPGFTGVAHPEVFTTKPPQPTVTKPGQLSEEKINEYFKYGFTVVDNFFTIDEISPCKEAFKRLVNGIAKKLYDNKKVKNMYEDKDMGEQLILLEKEWPGAVMLLLKLGKLTPEFRALYQNEKLLNAVEQMIGPDIGAYPVWNTRPKTPGHRETEVPWHQDSSYFDLDSYETLITTAWVAFVDATPENGCMQFLRQEQKGLVGVHQCCDNFYLMLQEDEMINRFGADPRKDFITCPVKAGGIIFFNNVVPHRSIPNLSNNIRWAMDLRYQTPHRPWGMFGLTKGILLRSPDKPDHKPDWHFYETQDRYTIFTETDAKRKNTEVADEFDTTLTGPHMDQWQIVTHNKHIEQFFGEKKEKTTSPTSPIVSSEKSN